MSPIEHYFENLLTMDSDMKGEPNKNALSREVQEAIEICADYIKHNQLYSNAISDDNNAEMIDMLTELKSETKNNLAQERYQDLIEYFGGEDTVLKDRKEFKAWLERVKWHVKRADELARAFGQLRPTTTDCLLVEQIVDEVIEKVIPIKPKAMPSVTQQLSSELEKNSKKLEKDFGELDCISRAYLLDDSKYHTVFNDDTGNFEDVVYREDIEKAPPVTPIRPKGHWIYKKFDERTGITNIHICSKCGSPLASPYKSFCSACGSDNREVKV